MGWTEGKINQVIADIKKRALEDETFRKLCLDHPNEAIRKVSDMEVTEGLKINIIENKPDVDHAIIFVLYYPFVHSWLFFIVLLVVCKNCVSLKFNNI